MRNIELTKEFVENNFIDKDGYWDLKGLTFYLVCGITTAKRIFKKFGLNPKRNGNFANYNQDIYKQLSKEFIEDNYVDEDGFWLPHILRSDLGCSVRVAKEYFDRFKIECRRDTRKRHWNINNYNLITKELLMIKFIDDDNIWHPEELALWLNCDRTSANTIFREYDLKFEFRNGGGFDISKPGTLYYILDIITGLYKIGITNNDIKRRFGARTQDLKVIFEKYYDKGIDAYNEEQRILEEFSYARVLNDDWPKELGGKTEFFDRDVLIMDL